MPTSEPKRYIRAGYVVLRWRLGTGVYVEALEHRIIMGRPDGHVHHINHIKTDNRPENLVALTREEHVEVHQAETRGPDSFWETVAAEYLAGASTTALGAKYGKSGHYIAKHLKKSGVQIRSGKPPYAAIDEQLAIEMLSQPGARATRVARYFGVSRIVMKRIQQEHGIQPAPVGRPPASAPEVTR